MDIPFTDAHTHHFPQDEANILYCADLSSEEKILLPAGKKLLFSLGIHPCKTGREDIDFLRKKLENNPAFSAVGECGIDKTLSIPIAEQKELFLLQAALAQEYEKPLIIHCVKAWDILYECAKKFPEKGRKWLIHSFRGDLALAQDLLRHNFTLSLAPQFVLHAPEKAEKFAALPFLLETDDTQENIVSIYEKMAKNCKNDVERIKEKVLMLFKDFFAGAGGE